MKYAMYSNVVAGWQGTSNYPMFTPEVYKTKAPTKSGSATYLGEINTSSQQVTIYGNSMQADTTVMDQVFYLYAGRGTGWYTFDISSADDLEMVWVGPWALSGWNRANSQMLYHFFGPTNPATLSYYLTSGTYTPVRVMWANGGGPGLEQLQIWAPDGSTMLLSSATSNSGYMSPHIVQAPCNSSLGSAFPSWGKET
jgi:hypothetical protein